MKTPSTPTSCWYLLVFLHSEWASARGIDENIGGKNKEELNKNLRLFYGAASNKNGGNYSTSMILGFRNGIERFLNNPPFKKGIHIATDPALQQSNQMLDAKLKNMKQQGEQSVKHKPCIENEDLRCLKESTVMNSSMPQGLLNNVTNITPRTQALWPLYMYRISSKSLIILWWFFVTIPSIRRWF